MTPADRDLFRRLSAEVWMSRTYRHGTTWELQYLWEGEAGNCTSFAYTVAYLLPEGFDWSRLALAFEDLGKSRHVELLVDGSLYVDPVRGTISDEPRGTVQGIFPAYRWDELRLIGNGSNMK